MSRLDKGKKVRNFGPTMTDNHCFHVVSNHSERSSPRGQHNQTSAQFCLQAESTARGCDK